MNDIKDVVLNELKENDGVLQMKPSWVSRDYLPSGKRLGLRDSEYETGKRGEICERWLVSETQADNRYYVEHEGQSHLEMKASKDADILLPDALRCCPAEILGKEYSKKHKGLDRLLKVFDYKTRLFYHFHQMEKDAKKVGRNCKEEAYYFLDADTGAHPETFFGVHPYVVRKNLQSNIFLPLMKEWAGEEILKYTKAYLNVPGEGFHVPAGILHAPGTALTLELQESSDVMAILQGKVENYVMPENLMFKDIPKEEVEKNHEQAVLDEVDWHACSDPYFFENHHLFPQKYKEFQGGCEEWVWYNSSKFSGSRITIQPGNSYVSKALGVHGIFIWQGEGYLDNFHIEGQKVSLDHTDDEFLITHDKALSGVKFVNTGNIPLVVFKFFGPDINNSIIPHIEKIEF